METSTTGKIETSGRSKPTPAGLIGRQFEITGKSATYFGAERPERPGI
jgi:hypothetical protein